jgi:hypothetical protein
VFWSKIGLLFCYQRCCVLCLSRIAENVDDSECGAAVLWKGRLCAGKVQPFSQEKSPFWRFREGEGESLDSANWIDDGGVLYETLIRLIGHVARVLSCNHWIGYAMRLAGDIGGPEWSLCRPDAEHRLHSNIVHMGFDQSIVGLLPKSPLKISVTI